MSARSVFNLISNFSAFERPKLTSACEISATFLCQLPLPQTGLSADHRRAKGGCLQMLNDSRYCLFEEEPFGSIPPVGAAGKQARNVTDDTCRTDPDAPVVPSQTRRLPAGRAVSM